MHTKIITFNMQKIFWIEGQMFVSVSSEQIASTISNLFRFKIIYDPRSLISELCPGIFFSKSRANGAWAIFLVVSTSFLVILPL